MISMLIIQSIWDCKFQQIPIGVTILGGLAGGVWSILQGRTLESMFLGLIPGMVALCVGWVTREAIGYGDGFLLCAMGMYLPIERIIGILLSACVLAGVVGLILLVVKKGGLKMELPFVPFLLVTSVAEVFWLGR